MNSKIIQRWLPAYQWLAGLSDTATGILLVIAPAWTLRLMGLKEVPAMTAFISFVGVFVLSVGLMYLLAARWPRNARFAARWQMVWLITALTRSLVALFLITQVLAQKMETGWLTVACFDGLLATIQWVGLRFGWLEFEK